MIRPVQEVEDSSERMIKEKFYEAAVVALMYCVPATFQMISLGKSRQVDGKEGPWLSLLTFAGFLMMGSW